MKKNWPKFILGWVISFLIRLVPFRPPNVEPILGIQMPFSKAYGYAPAFLFAFSNIVLFDLLVNKFGEWTLITALAYGFLGIWGVKYFQNRKNSSLNYLRFSVMATLAYDAVTGLSIGPIFFNQPLMAAAIGQIPFTLLHLLGNCSFAVLASPLIYRYAVSKRSFRGIYLLNLKPLAN
ncbi:hypothetical protein A3H65_02710 [Candidatus Giovannonibacteria bacterium RIFCSPLOWO2_02_FULL_45_14]|uniref:Rod shape-determining protein MreD n=3 Tax=Parcubacteria group TaxID=1794811 RepID=A0A0H4TCC4_9BACT|nr:hypothetical protein [uncultured Parcubacteria bacterium Rifle_16ft_4_minimus_37658]AKQ05678.1 hypothetical protein [uncultured Parcubacteria bacterium Rifle_16ft_4_minimus_23641]OGF69929.1 MAG: hypothetical protein A3C75_01125 [Candidatus Giovannonibacteria bacterium RIFCSPHIGHO2_02_FULL_44_31]OGF76968.1 MAG: hypothetical protein A3E62_01365 [Candidatus Giovannonibacteria bacterium RIFCSPHIGHO2_12_FULL_44_29]OGF90469.1 MAG: hypothetical protein A3H65_02710 [Candidatus Giovannonibacteria bac